MNHPSVRGVPKEVMTEIVTEILSLDRQWRKILEENEDMRGNDYDGGKWKLKEQLEQEHQMKVGYESGFNQLSTLK